jgi:hypothetical protein
MAADCKSAGPSDLRRFESSPVHHGIEMNRLGIALAAYAVLAGLVWLTVDHQKIRFAAWLILALFAVRTLVWEKRMQQERKSEGDSE